MKTARIIPVLLVHACLLPACTTEHKAQDGGTQAGASGAPRVGPHEEGGDLPAIRKRGKLRILIPERKEMACLPRQGFPPDLERELAAQFARNLELEPVLVRVASYADLIPYLLSGKGDLVVAGLTATAERRKRVAFTSPVAVVREQLVTRKKDEGLEKPSDLTGRKIAVRRSSSYWASAQALAKEQPGVEIVAAPEHLDTEQILYRVARNEYDLTVADSNLVQAVSGHIPELRVAFDLSGHRPWAWAIRPDAPGLRKALDQFLGEVQLTEPVTKTHTQDLAGIKKRKVLRVLTRNSAATYFLWRGDLMGFEYELVREFAKKHDLNVKLVVPPSHEDLLPWLLAGRGDLVAAALTTTEERKQQGVAFSRPYHLVTETLVARADDSIAQPADLAGRTVVVRKSSAYWRTLEKLRDTGIKMKIEAAPEELETEEIIARVASGAYDLTVADSHIVDIELTHRDDIRKAFALGDEVAHGWAMRPGSRKLKAAVDAFLKKEYRGVFYNITRRKYFESPKVTRTRVAARPARTGAISPYDDLLRKYAEQYGFDWRLLAAQAYAESRFDPQARSWVGAEGLMQVMPRTARELGFEDVTRPEDGVHAGAKYMARVRAKFEDDLPLAERNWFALAAYNAGYGHVLDARRLAERKGWDPDKWFESVERAMLLLSRPRYARRARYGYCRGAEPVQYVQRIRKSYDAYKQVAGQ